MRATEHADPLVRLEAETSTQVLSMVLAGFALEDALDRGERIGREVLLRRAGELHCAGLMALNLVIRIRALIECGGIAH